MSRAVLLEHRTLDGSSHYDWLLERPSGGFAETADARDLIAFRVAVRIDKPEIRHFVAERIGDHRRRYLDYEGEISGGRGRVRRLASGRCDLREEKPTTISAVIDWGVGLARYRGHPVDPVDGRSWWRFVHERLGG